MYITISKSNRIYSTKANIKITHMGKEVTDANLKNNYGLVYEITINNSTKGYLDKCTEHIEELLENGDYVQTILKGKPFNSCVLCGEIYSKVSSFSKVLVDYKQIDKYTYTPVFIPVEKTDIIQIFRKGKNDDSILIYELE